MPFLNEMVDSFKDNAGGPHSEMEPDRDKQFSEDAGCLPSKFAFSLAEVEQTLRLRIKGQDTAIQSVVDSLKIAKAGLQRPDRPLFVSLLVGPTGVGKTEIVRVLAESIWGSSERVCRVDMNTLSQEHYAAALTGPPPGYVGSKEGYTVLDKEKIEGSFSKPGIVLFDEIEKSSSVVIQTLLNVFDNGVLTMASGNRKFDFRNSLIFMTSNIGARNIIRYHRNDSLLLRIKEKFSGNMSREERVLRIVRKDMDRLFEPEFINRIDKIIAFNWLGMDTVRDIVDLEFGALNSRLRPLGAELVMDIEVKELVSTKGFDDTFGARSIYRTVRSEIELPLAEELMRRPPDGDQRAVYRLSRKGERVVVRRVE